MSYFSDLLTFGAVGAVIVISPGLNLMVTMRLAMTPEARNDLTRMQAFGTAARNI